MLKFIYNSEKDSIRVLRDVSEWELIGYGGKSTLEKEELKSPDRKYYLIKYPRDFEIGLSWEDITELIAAEIGTIFGMEMMNVEIVTRNGRRGCLLRNFVKDHNALMAEEGGSLLLSLSNDYEKLYETELRSYELINFGFEIMKAFPFWNIMKQEFIDMQIFDILIGNQDRHPFNWTLLFFSNDVGFSPVYDNGASLGFRFDDEQLAAMLRDEQKIKWYVNKTQVKAGIYEKKKVKAVELMHFLKVNFAKEFAISIKKLNEFDLKSYSTYIENLDVLSEVQKAWLLNIIPYRRKQILEWSREG